ncbi:hypothetical protein [uncultured Lamprocystis sp.]|jgi:hypothetical protein|uniref:hypothetical protein n=1 Tax=uncultured Lamprocystis sp. TaxID=543132 RepID=UPI0025CFAD98|nr:hypothetical protein [uncultured Lamprocystis sp.]
MPDILKIREALKRRSEALGVLQMTPPDSEDALREALVKTNRLREVFAETPDEASIGEMVAQIESLLADMAVWPAGDTRPERLEALLNLQVEHQAAALCADLDAIISVQRAR